MTQPSETTNQLQESPAQEPAQEPTPPPAPEVKLRKPQENPFLKWRVEGREGGIMREHLLGDEAECREEFDRLAAKLKSGSLQLYKPGFGVPVAQVTKPSFLPSVHIPEDYQQGDKLPPLQVKRPDPELIKKYFPVDGLPIEEQMEADARRIEMMKNLQSLQSVQPTRTPMPALAAVSSPDASDLIRDLAIVDEALRNMELARIVVANHRNALIKKIAEDQSAEGCQSILARTLDSLKRLQ